MFVLLVCFTLRSHRRFLPSINLFPLNERTNSPININKYDEHTRGIITLSLSLSLSLSLCVCKLYKRSCEKEENEQFDGNATRREMQVLLNCRTSLAAISLTARVIINTHVSGKWPVYLPRLEER